MKQAISAVLFQCVFLLFLAGVSIPTQAEDDTYEEDTIFDELMPFLVVAQKGLLML